jgi:hypothetical protein
MTTEPVYPEVAANGDLVVPVRPPEAREAVAVAEYDGRVLGQRVVVLQPTAWVFDLRAVSERYEDGRAGRSSTWRTRRRITSVGPGRTARRSTRRWSSSNGRGHRRRGDRPQAPVI